MRKLKLIALSLLMLVSIKTISQNATVKNQFPAQIQKNNVVIDTSVAHLISIDLVKGDECAKEIKLVNENLELTKQKSSFKDTIISTLNKQKDGYKSIISKQDDMYQKQTEISNSYKKDLSKQKTATLIYKLLSLLGVTSTLLLILRH